jgi:hypothetical protein
VLRGDGSNARASETKRRQNSERLRSFQNRLLDLRGLLESQRLDVLGVNLVSGAPMTLRRVVDVLNTDAMLFQEFCDRFSKYGDKSLTLFADGQAVEVPVF